MHSQGHCSIKMDVTEACIAPKIKGCKNRVTEIKQEIATILGLHENVIEITRPQPTPNGLSLHINLYINDAEVIDLKQRLKSLYLL